MIQGYHKIANQAEQVNRALEKKDIRQMALGRQESPADPPPSRPNSMDYPQADGINWEMFPCEDSQGPLLSNPSESVHWETIDHPPNHSAATAVPYNMPVDIMLLDTGGFDVGLWAVSVYAAGDYPPEPNVEDAAVQTSPFSDATTQFPLPPPDHLQPAAMQEESNFLFLRHVPFHTPTYVSTTTQFPSPTSAASTLPLLCFSINPTEHVSIQTDAVNGPVPSVDLDPPVTQLPYPDDGVGQTGVPNPNLSPGSDDVEMQSPSDDRPSFNANLIPDGEPSSNPAPSPDGTSISSRGLSDRNTSSESGTSSDEDEDD
ncbi:hypothetical protein GALMADRAFT_147597 [Galerina marginata CBS 339.88]|uniref:Uncharacterized protein n=1 Tax=Galerina marginata (strain CBS 339.88) TaxID=685588 RepID=A0A067SJQ8_GALM3|nr:hypothetical protein GALMADRAFT_147597 [Galerina marginata CBS 339.88]